MPPKLLRNVDAAGHQRWIPLAPPPPEPPPPDPTHLYEEARRDALATAGTLLESARAEAETIRQRAHELGMTEGQAAVEEAYQRRVADVQALVEEMNTERAAFFTRAEADLARLATVIAEKVVAQHLALRPETVIDITRSCLKRIRDREEIFIRAHPDDMPVLLETRATLLMEVDGITDFHLVEDRRIHRGGVIVETASGSLDARIPSQIAVVTKAIESAVEEPGEPVTD